MESVELYKTNCFELSMELEKMKVELEKKKVESTELQGKLAEVEETRMSTAEDEKATEYWRKRCSDLESLVQRMENENSTMTCVESPVSNLGSLVAWNGKESSILRRQGSEKIESEITQTGEKQRDENSMSQPTTSFLSGSPMPCIQIHNSKASLVAEHQDNSLPLLQKDLMFQGGSIRLSEVSKIRNMDSVCFSNLISLDLVICFRISYYKFYNGQESLVLYSFPTMSRVASIVLTIDCSLVHKQISGVCSGV